MENSYIETINKYIKNENYAFLDKVFENYDNLSPEKALSLLKYALKSDLVKKQKASYTANYTFFWKQISYYYDQFNSDEKEEILQLIKNLQAYNKSTAESLYHLVIKAFTTIEEKREYLCFLIKNNHIYEFIEDNDLRCLWFIEQVKSQANSYIDYNNFKMLEFNFNEQLWKELILYLTKIDENTIYNPFTSILEKKGVNLTFYCLKEEKLLYQGKHEFSNEFYHLKIIQRLFINIDLEQDLDEETLEKVISNIDTSFRFYGKEMNEFVKKHQELFPKTISPDYFINGFEVESSGWIHQYPYLSINMLLNQKIETSIETLLNSKDLIPLEDFKERSIEGQIRELSRLFTETYSVDNKEQIIALLKALIENNILYCRYCECIVEFFVVSEDRVRDNIGLLVDFIEKTKISNEFNFHLSKLYRFLFKNGFIEVEQVKERFFDYRVDNFSIKNVFIEKEEKSYIDINVYINTEVGRYFDTIKTLGDEILDKKDIQDLVIKQLQDTPESYKSYIIGQFPCIWGEIPELVPTIDLYQGFSYKYRIGKNELEWFKPIIKEILETDNFDDSITLFNSMIILFETTSPQDISVQNHDYFNKLALKMLDGYLENDYEFRYSEAWINYLLCNEEYSKSLINNLFPRLSKIKTDKIERILLFLEKMPLHRWKLKNYSYSYALCEQFKKEQLKYISKLITLLLKKEIVNVDYECIECIESILEQMDEFEMITNINQLLNEVRAYLTTEDYTKLNDKFRYLRKQLD